VAPTQYYGPSQNVFHCGTGVEMGWMDDDKAPELNIY